jgi:PAS domain-containing protein
VQHDNEADVGLGASAPRFDWLVESLVDCPVALVDANCRVMSWDRGLRLITGYSPREAIGTRLSRCCGPDLPAWRAESEASNWPTWEAGNET